MTIPKALARVADQVEATFAKHNVRLTLGGEPTYLPNDPTASNGASPRSARPSSATATPWPTRRYGYALADALIAQSLPRAVAIYSPGKFYPGEVNPRWAINLVWNRDDTPLVPALAAHDDGSTRIDAKSFRQFEQKLARRLNVQGGWLRAPRSLRPRRAPPPCCRSITMASHSSSRTGAAARAWSSCAPMAPPACACRLNSLPAEVNRRALTAEIVEGRLHVFLPPLLQKPFLALLEAVAATARELGLETAASLRLCPRGRRRPLDASRRGRRSWSPRDQSSALRHVARIRRVARRSRARRRARRPAFVQTALARGTESARDGGNHLLFGGPSLDDHPLFSRPAWVTSILRYWQHHPSLAYLFTGQYVGSSSQAPRPDEGASAHYDLEMAYRFLEELPPGDHRYLISETLRHLHTDTSGNTHRSEASFDKFWNVNFDGGCRGLVEFRAVETLPHARWMSVIALLWHALAAHLLTQPFKEPLIDFGNKLHDAFFLPSFLWADFEKVLRDLRRGGFDLPATLFREIFEWRFPVMLHHAEGAAELTIRRGHEGWPLLCEQPLEGGSTSRFVDTSIERLEFVVSREFAARCTIRVAGAQASSPGIPRGETRSRPPLSAHLTLPLLASRHPAADAAHRDGHRQRQIPVLPARTTSPALRRAHRRAASGFQPAVPQVAPAPRHLRPAALVAVPGGEMRMRDSNPQQNCV